MSAPFGLNFDIGSVVIKPCPVFAGNIELTFRVAGHGVAKVSIGRLQGVALSEAMGTVSFLARGGNDWQKVNAIARGDS